MNTGKLLAVDFGQVRIGLAVSDPERKFSFPLETYTRRGSQRDADHFRAVVKEEGIVALVVGLPMHTDGREGQKATEARTAEGVTTRAVKERLEGVAREFDRLADAADSAPQMPDQQAQKVAQLRDHHDDTQRAMCRASQSDAGGPRP